MSTEDWGARRAFTGAEGRTVIARTEHMVSLLRLLAKIKCSYLLISLVGDIPSIRGQYIKWVFGAGSGNRSLLCSLHGQTLSLQYFQEWCTPFRETRKYEQ